VVLLLLALVWGALLVSWLRSRTATTFSDSVGTFRRHLTVLEKATPTSVRPANRLNDRPAPSQSATVRAFQGPVGPRSLSPSGRLSRPGAANASVLRRRQAQKRRRDVFFALTAGAVGSLLLALIPGLSVMWAAQIVFDLLLGSYCAILVKLRNAAAERELKLRFMPGAQPRRRLQPGYEFAGGYGDLEWRRAAN
jgi:hypothetical protein